MTIEKLFEQWMEKEFGEDVPAEDVYLTYSLDKLTTSTCDLMLQAFKAGRKSRNKKRSSNKKNPYSRLPVHKFSSSVLFPGHLNN